MKGEVIMATTGGSKVSDTVEVETLTVVCDMHGHPRVTLRLDPATRAVVCPYCSRHFTLKHGAKGSAGTH